MKKKVALVTGITGQDGAYLVKLLLKKNYVVHGIKRRTSFIYTPRYDDIYIDPYFAKTDFKIHYADLTDHSSLTRVINEILPDEIYNLAAQSHVGVSFELPIYTSDVVAMGTLRLLEIIKNLKKRKKIKFYQASSSEMFGKTKSPQNEDSLMQPLSPYAISKLYSYWISKCYRDSYGLFASNGILFNHESPTRGENFVTRKITLGVAKIEKGLQSKIVLGNLDSKRDWGDAEEYVEAMWKILQYRSADDFVIATGKSITVRKFVEMAFKVININIIFKGKGINEKGYNAKNGKLLVEVNKDYFRPNEVNDLRGNATKALRKLNWKPKTNLQNLVKKMVNSDRQKIIKNQL